MATNWKPKRDVKPHAGRLRSWRSKIWNAQNRRCLYCECVIAFADSTLDHVVPKSKGGPWKKSNMVVACQPCNQKRGDMDFQEFMELCGK